MYMLTIDKGKPFLIFKDKYCVTYICLLIFYIYIPSHRLYSFTYYSVLKTTQET